MTNTLQTELHEGSKSMFNAAVFSLKLTADCPEELRKIMENAMNDLGVQHSAERERDALRAERDALAERVVALEDECDEYASAIGELDQYARRNDAKLDDLRLLVTMANALVASRVADLPDITDATHVGGGLDPLSATEKE